MDISNQKKAGELTTAQWLKTDAFKKAITEVMPQGVMTPDRFIKSAQMLFMMKKELQACTKESFFMVLKECASLGIDVSPTLAQAYIIPYKSSNPPYGVEVKLQLGYRGLIELSRRTGDIATITAECVCENDTFDVEVGTSEHFIHKPNYIQGRGEVIAYYCFIRFKSGEYQYAVMTKDEVEQVRQGFSKSKDSPAWKKSFDEMAKKTVIKRLLKLCPVSINAELQIALEQDNKETEVVDLPQEEVITKPAPQKTQTFQEQKPEIVEVEATPKKATTKATTKETPKAQVAPQEVTPQEQSQTTDEFEATMEAQLQATPQGQVQKPSGYNGWVD